MFRHPALSCSLFVFASLLLQPIALAEDITWAGGASTDWHNVLNWNAVTGPPFVWRVPGNTDTATLSDTSQGTTVTLSADTAGVNGLTLQNGFWLDTSGYFLLVDQAGSAQTSIYNNSQITARVNASNPLSRAFDSDTLLISEGGNFYLDGAVADVDVYTQIHGFAVPDGVLEGNGTMHFGSTFSTPGSTVLWNQGTIRVSGIGDATLTLEARNSGVLDLGAFGDVNGMLDVDDGISIFSGAKTLEVIGDMAEFFGDLIIGRDDTADFSDPWTATSAEIHFNGNTSTATLSGAALDTSHSLVSINSGVAAILCDASFGTNTTVDVDATLQLDGLTTFASSADLDLNDATALIINGDTTVNQSVIDLDSNGGMDVTVNSGGRLTLNVDKIDDDVPAGFNRNMNIGGTLDANVTGGWDADGDIQLTGGRIIGSTINNAGTIRGNGSIGATGLVNDGTISAEGGTLILDSPGNTFDLDGATNLGVLNAMAGNIEVQEGDVTFEGTLNIGAGRSFVVTDGIMAFDNDTGPGALNIHGGTIQTHDDLYLYGTTTVDTAPSMIKTITSDPNGYISFRPGSNLVVNTDLTLDPYWGTSFWETSTITGTGRIFNLQNKRLYIQENVDLDVEVHNAGVLWISTGSEGVGYIDKYIQTNTGLLAVGITGPSSTDLLSVDTTATLDGRIQMWRSNPENYEPVAGDSWVILQAAGGISGQFDSVITWPDPLTGRLFWYIEHDTIGKQVVVHVLEALEADFDHDGKVDESDWLIWEDGFGTLSSADHTNGDADGDGDVDGLDFLKWQSQNGLSLVFPSSTSAATAAVPEPNTLLLIGITAMATLSRRVRRTR